MKKPLLLVGQIISVLVAWTGFALAVLTEFDLIDGALIIGVVLFLLGLLCTIIIAQIRAKIRMAEIGLTKEDIDFFFKSPSIYFTGAIFAAAQAIKYEKRFKLIKALYDNQEYDKVIAETTKYYPDIEKIPPSLKKLLVAAKSFKDNEGA